MVLVVLLAPWVPSVPRVPRPLRGQGHRCSWMTRRLRPPGALAGALANPSTAPASAPNAAAIAATEVERMYGPLACKALPALLEWLALRSDLDALAGETHAITMMTVHSAKGLEFPAVFVAGMEEGIFPHVAGWTDDDPAKLEEERRLAYVAITRARKRLFLTYAATRRTYGSTQANPRSRFVNEIPSEHIEFSGIGSSGFEGTGWEKRGDRRGTFGSGKGSDMYGGRVFGSLHPLDAGYATPHRDQPRRRARGCCGCRRGSELGIPQAVDLRLRCAPPQEGQRVRHGRAQARRNCCRHEFRRGRSREPQDVRPGHGYLRRWRYDRSPVRALRSDQEAHEGLRSHRQTDLTASRGTRPAVQTSAAVHNAFDSPSIVGRHEQTRALRSR